MTDTRFVLIPGAGGDGWYWHRVVPLLQAAKYDAVAVDLPNQDGAELADHVDAVVAAAAGAPAVVLVAQSMGAFATPQAAGRLPVTRVVLVNAMIPIPGETPGAWWDATGQGDAQRENERRAGRDPDADFDPMVTFLHDVPAEVLAESADHAAIPPDSLFATACDFARWPPVPTTVVVAEEDRLFPADFQRRVARDRLGLDAVAVPGGHLVALSRPAELTAALLAG